MMHAYSELYLSQAQRALGGMMQYAVRDLNLEAGDFYILFLSTEIAYGFGKGEPKYTVGMSGAEIAREVIRLTKGEIEETMPSYSDFKPPEYWAGWAVAYYEWYRNIPFRRINAIVPIDEIISMYNPYHEADITKFAFEMDRRMKDAGVASQLARLRAYAGLTQKMLAERTGVSVRMIEQYEQRKKDLRHASVDTVYRLATGLHCSVEDLIAVPDLRNIQDSDS